MTHVRQLFAVARACFSPASPQTIIGVSTYGGYLVWLAIHEVAFVGDTVYIHLTVAVATAGAWIGNSVGRIARWPGAAFTPSLVAVLGIVATLAGVSALGLNGAAAWLSGLDTVPVAQFGPFALAAGLACGRTRPMLAMYLLLCLGILIPLGPLLKPEVPLPGSGEASTLAAGAAFVAATALITQFAHGLSSRNGGSSQCASSPPWRTTTANLLFSRPGEPTVRRVTITSGLLAAGCTIAHRWGLEWQDATLISVIGAVCTILGTTSPSASLPRGPLPDASWLLLSGIAKTRPHAARRVLWRIVTDSLFAAGVFTAVTVVLGPDWRLVEMMLVALAACHAYLAAACPSRWLLSSRLSVFVATPVVVAVAVAAWDLVHWDLPTAFAACVLSGVAAVYVGGIGMGRIDLDPVPNTEPAL